jgi:hypothetical protein
MKVSRLPPRRSRASQRASQSESAGQHALVPYNTNTSFTDVAKLPRFPSDVYNVILSSEIISFLLANTATPTFAAQNFALANFASAAQYASAFDQYRICMVEAVLRPTNNLVTVGSNLGEVTVVIDYDDSNALTSVSQALEYDNQVTVPGYLPVRRCWKPRIAMAAYQGTFTGYVNASDQWLDMANTGIQYFGLKTAWTSVTASTLPTYDLITRAHVQFRCAR